ncbi:MAG: hypothetical protein ACT4N4_11210, partial [Rhodospirillales bacterium]
FCHRVCLVLREFLLVPQAAVLPADRDTEALRLLKQHNSWVVRGADGATRLKWRAMAYLLRQCPVTAPMGWLTDLPALRPAMAQFYDCIGANRHRLGAPARAALPLRAEPPLAMPAQALCAALMALALIGNLGSVHLPTFGGGSAAPDAPEPYNRVLAALQVAQRWDLFAPMPVFSQQHFGIAAILADGTRVDLMRALPRPPVRHAANGYSVTFANGRWLRYFSRMDHFDPAQWIALGRYFCRQARESVPAPPREVELVRYVQSPFEAWNPAIPPRDRRIVDCGPAWEKPG